jgi:hypothetical protein
MRVGSMNESVAFLHRRRSGVGVEGHTVKMINTTRREDPDIGKRVRLLSSSKRYIPMSPGDIGIMWHRTESGTWRILLNNGNYYDLDPDTDRWEVLHSDAIP